MTDSDDDTERLVDPASLDLPDADRLATLLRDRFGFESLFAFQARVIQRVLGENPSGSDAMVVQSTGAGKSLCYQLPALVLRERSIERGEGPCTTLVFSPLVALMEDQAQALVRKGIDAGFVNATVGRREREKRIERLARGEYEIFFATPERMERPGFLDAIRAIPGGVPLLGIDEMHCISAWGHDLRPDYRRVGEFRRTLGEPITLALTATATRAVREEVREVLDLDEVAMPLVAGGVDRPNLTMETRPIIDDRDRIAAVRSCFDELGGTSIVYFALIRDLDHFVRALREAMPERPVEVYHGRLEAKERRRVLRRFIDASPEEGLILCATNAFGMGVDKPDIRTIVHAQIPGSIESWFQEIGRAGRDGKPSRCVLCLAEADIAIQHEFAEWSNPSAELLHRIDDVIRHRGHADFDAEDLREEVLSRRESSGVLQYALIELDRLGVIEPTSIVGRYRFVRPLTDEDLDPETMQAKRRRDLERLLAMVRLARLDDPREALLSYFELGNSPT